MSRSSPGGLALLAVVTAATACSWGPLHRDRPSPPPPPPADVTVPALEIRPTGGAFAAIQYVTLAADEPATIRYTLDGSEPVEGAPGTFSAPSPVLWLRMGEGTTLLRAVAVDEAGNVSVLGAETYLVTVLSPDAPVVTVTTPPPAPVPILGDVTLGFEADQAGTAVVELGEGFAGAGSVVFEGTIDAHAAVALVVGGLDVAGDRPKYLWIAVTNARGLTGWNAVRLVLAPPVEIASSPGTACDAIALDAAGTRAFASAGDRVRILDVDPASPAYEAVIAERPIAGEVSQLAVVPGGSRLYVAARATEGGAGGLLSVGIATDGAVGLSSVAYGAGATVDGKRLYVAQDAAISIVDVDEASATYAQVIGTVADVAEYPGAVAISPDGKRAIFNRMVVDVERGSGTRDRVVGVLPVSAVLGTPAFSTDGAFAYVSGCTAANGCTRLVQVEMVGLTITADEPLPAYAYSASAAPTPDGEHLVVRVERNDTPIVQLAARGGPRARGFVHRAGGALLAPQGRGRHAGRDPRVCPASGARSRPEYSCRVLRIPLH